MNKARTPLPLQAQTRFAHAVIMLVLCGLTRAAEPVTCALIIDRSERSTVDEMATLLETSLQAEDGTRWVERQAIETVLKEHELAAALSPQGVAER